METVCAAKPGFVGRVVWLGIAYAAAFGIAAAVDLVTTAMALTHQGAAEANVYATTDAGAYVSGRAWLLTLVAGLVIEAYLLFGALNARKVADVWLAHPFRSFAKVYVNPFAKRVIDRSPLHALCYTLAFPLLRILAGVNNLMICAGLTPPFGWLIGVLSHKLGLTVSFWLVMGPTYVLLTFLTAPAAARVIRWLRGETAPAIGARAAA